MIVVPQISSAFSNIGLVNHLRQSETKYRTLVAGMQDVVYICDRHWSILDANPAANALFGGSIIGRTLTELFALRTPQANSSRVCGQHGPYKTLKRNYSIPVITNSSLC